LSRIPQAAPATLRIDDEDSGRSDQDVVDVAARAWDAAIAEQQEARHIRQRIG
jgi:hypothetical protein